MKLGPIIKLDRKNKPTPKHFDYDVVSANCDVIEFFPIYGQLWAIWKPDSERIVCKTYIFIKSNLLCYKNWKRTKKSQTQLSHYCFE